MSASGYRMSEAALFNELFGSSNFVNGGVGRRDAALVLRSTTEERLAAAADAHGADLLLMGTDYVVIKRGVPYRRVDPPAAGGPPTMVAL